ncbi:MAG: histidine phosphatase family protein [Myxococcota bacterium]
MELLVIRHGLPLRIERDDGAPADPELSELGQRQAERVAEWLKDEPIEAIYASPLHRAHQTAMPLAAAKGLPIQLEPGIVEFNPDAQSYIPLEELKATDPEAWRALVQGGLHAEIDFDLFRQTVVSSLERIIAANPSRVVAVVCHGGVINSWVAHILGIDTPLFFDPTYTSINRSLAASSGERMVVSLNETAHLRGLARG